MNTSHKDSRLANAADKWAKALELRKSGHTYEHIAAAVGYASKGAARDAVMRGIKEIVREPAEEVLALELARLDDMLIRALELARAGDPQAIDAVLKIMNRRSKYLGMDSPEKIIQVDGAASTPAQARQIMKELFGSVTPEPDPTPE